MSKYSRTADCLEEHLFSTPEEMTKAGIPAPVRERLLRIRDIYTYWLNYPRTTEREVTKEITKRYKIRPEQAHQDIRLIKVCLGRFNQVTRDYDSYRFRQLLEEGLEMARTKNDAASFAKLLSSYGKMARLDKEEADAPAYDDIVPQQFKLTSDPSVLGITPVSDWRRKAEKLRAQWAKEAKVVEVVELEPLDDSNK